MKYQTHNFKSSKAEKVQLRSSFLFELDTHHAKEFYTSSELALKIRYHIGAVLKLIRDKTIEAEKIKGIYQIHRLAIREFLIERETKDCYSYHVDCDNTDEDFKIDKCASPNPKVQGYRLKWLREKDAYIRRKELSKLLVEIKDKNLSTIKLSEFSSRLNLEPFLLTRNKTLKPFKDQNGEWQISTNRMIQYLPRPHKYDAIKCKRIREEGIKRSLEDQQRNIESCIKYRLNLERFQKLCNVLGWDSPSGEIFRKAPNRSYSRPSIYLYISGNCLVPREFVELIQSIPHVTEELFKGLFTPVNVIEEALGQGYAMNHPKIRNYIYHHAV